MTPDNRVRLHQQGREPLIIPLPLPTLNFDGRQRMSPDIMMRVGGGAEEVDPAAIALLPPLSQRHTRSKGVWTLEEGGSVSWKGVQPLDKLHPKSTLLTCNKIQGQTWADVTRKPPPSAASTLPTRSETAAERKKRAGSNQDRDALRA